MGGLDSLQSINVGLVAVIGGLVLGAMVLVMVTIAIVMGERRKVVQAREFEQSRREIAAYVAEGSIKPEDAAKVLSAKPQSAVEAITEMLS